jgi:hypothetical protein
MFTPDRVESFSLVILKFTMKAANSVGSCVFSVLLQNLDRSEKSVLVHPLRSNSSQLDCSHFG